MIFIKKAVGEKPKFSEIKNVIQWGAGDQGRVNWPILNRLGIKVVGWIDDTTGLPSPDASAPIFKGFEAFVTGLPAMLESAGLQISELGFVVSIGNPYGTARRQLSEKLHSAGLSEISFHDSTAFICHTAEIDAGAQIMPAAKIHSFAKVGGRCIINTSALVEHDCVLEDGVEIGPGAVLCGRVKVCQDAWVAANATVLPRLVIGRGAIVGAGAVVTRDVPDGVVVKGCPAR